VLNAQRPQDGIGIANERIGDHAPGITHEGAVAGREICSRQGPLQAAAVFLAVVDRLLVHEQQVVVGMAGGQVADVLHEGHPQVGVQLEETISLLGGREGGCADELHGAVRGTIGSLIPQAQNRAAGRRLVAFDALDRGAHDREAGFEPEETVEAVADAPTRPVVAGGEQGKAQLTVVGGRGHQQHPG